MSTGGAEPGRPQVTVSERGFVHMAPIQTSYGHEVRVYESSGAREPCIWLGVQGTVLDQADPKHLRTMQADVAAHCTFKQAREIRDQIDWLLTNHYQVRSVDHV